MTRKRKLKKESKGKRKRFKASSYESAPREPGWKGKDDKEFEKVRFRLPIKTDTGWLLQDPVPLEDNDSDKEVDDQVVPEDLSDHDMDDADDELLELSEEDDELQESSEPLLPLSTAEVLASREMKLNKRKDLIADCSSRILEDPQENVHLLNKLCILCIDRTSEMALTVRKLSMISLVTVYKDIIPGYCIRDLTASEKSVKVSKDVQRLRSYEQKLLQYYDKYISILTQTVQAGLSEKNKLNEVMVKGRNYDIVALESGLSISPTGLENLSMTALQCICELSKSLYHFNYHERLFLLLAHGLTSSKRNGNVAATCKETVSTVFKNDRVGETSLEIVQLISKLLKSRGYSTRPQVVQVLLHLNLQHVEEPVNQLGGGGGGAKKKLTQRQKRLEKQKMNRKQRRKFNARARLERELREVEAEERIDKKVKLQTEIIKLVFMIYFRVLKQAQDSPLLSSVLEGLAKFAHLISVDYFADLMSVLHSLMERNILSFQQSMECIVTAFQILSGQGEALNIDPRQFYCKLYTNLLQLDHRTNQYNMSLVISCLEKVTKQRKKISSERVLGIVKRMGTMSLQLPPASALGLLATMRIFFQSYRSYISVLLDNEEESAGGVFNPNVPDPEVSSSSSTNLWELATLRSHYDPYVSCYAEHLIKGAPSQGPGSLSPHFSQRNPVLLMESHSWQSVDPFNNIPSLRKKEKRNSAISRKEIGMTVDGRLDCMKDHFSGNWRLQQFL
ncbi:PREDICTED: nucleolar complex protein 3 homolog isoform X2 [Amphimedon queenslandica]|uniref:NOC3-like protein n=1 Tax=Amphimedon queenslandica TaxID=400682 RepID=A0AAN0IXA9_AMPQE|nr:PREDICTED: nucleolar complex protein 3 homolog isoform X2 [Amphimedon queenslandica]|eukprot:XP_019849404.1 PREDICTED: nucleolar complex protein 3 homolog isoform X2 [Amphimedon queenslandica]